MCSLVMFIIKHFEVYRSSGKLTVESFHMKIVHVKLFSSSRALNKQQINFKVKNLLFDSLIIS